MNSVPIYFLILSLSSFQSLHWTTFTAYNSLLVVLIFYVCMNQVLFTDCISKPVLKIDTLFPPSRTAELLKSVQYF